LTKLIYNQSVHKEYIVDSKAYAGISVICELSENSL